MQMLEDFVCVYINHLCVRCVSAGVGRTGTYIAVDTLMNQLREHDTVDVYGVVYSMRLNRPFMVQTQVSYS